MMHANDALDGTAGTGDTLDINMTQAVGTTIIDLALQTRLHLSTVARIPAFKPVLKTWILLVS